MTLVGAALRYAERGWKVFPQQSVSNGRCSCRKDECRSPGKHPRTPHGRSDATLDPHQIEAWWKAWPEANIGIATGTESGIVVVDVDARSGGLESLSAFPEDAAPRVRTPGGGLHLYYRRLGPTRSGPLADRPGIEVKGDGGGVNAPPSTHVGGVYVWEREGDLPDLPPHFTLPERRKPRGTSASYAWGVPEGQRDLALFRYACRLRTKGLSRDEILAAVLGAAARCSPPFPDGEAKRKVEQAMKFPSAELSTYVGLSDDEPEFVLDEVGGHVYRWPQRGVEMRLCGVHEERDGVWCEITVFFEVEGRPKVLMGPTRLNLLSFSAARLNMDRYLKQRVPSLPWAWMLEGAMRLCLESYRASADEEDLLASPGAPPRWLVYPYVLKTPQPTVVFSPGGVGKSFFALLVMLTAVCDTDFWLGLPPARKCAAAYLDWEADRETQADRTHRLLMPAREAGVLADGGIAYRRMTGPLHPQIAAIKQFVVAKGVDFIVVDSIGAAAGQGPEGAEAALRFFDALSRLKVPSLCVAHQPWKGEHVWGSVYYTNTPRSIWELKGEWHGRDSLELKLLHRKTNVSGTLSDLSYLLEFNGSPIKVTPQTTPLPPKGYRRAATIDEALAKGPLTLAEICGLTGLPEARARELLFLGLGESWETDEQGRWRTIPL